MQNDKSTCVVGRVVVPKANKVRVAQTGSELETGLVQVTVRA